MSVLQLATGVFLALTARDIINTGSTLLASWLNARRYRDLLAELEEYEFTKPKAKAKTPKAKA
jgi:hypothetical protein